MIDQNSVKRWVTQRCIGYRRSNGRVTHDVYGGEVELTDGRIVPAWQVSESAQPLYINGGYSFFYSGISETVFQQPPYDVSV